MFQIDEKRQGAVTFGQALGSQEGEPLVLGKPAPCPHCSATPAPRETISPKGRLVIAHIPSDTCCPARVTEIRKMRGQL